MGVVGLVAALVFGRHDLIYPRLATRPKLLLFESSGPVSIVESHLESLQRLDTNEHRTRMETKAETPAITPATLPRSNTRETESGSLEAGNGEVKDIGTDLRNLPEERRGAAIELANMTPEAYAAFERRTLRKMDIRIIPWITSVPLPIVARLMRLTAMQATLPDLLP